MDLRAQELGSATKDSDGKRPAHDTEAVGAQYDRRAIRKLSARNTTGALYESCRRTIPPARYTKAVGAQYDRHAARKLSARDTTGGATEAVGARED